jgi:transcription-repair coupling factor (superfamily II helicase)
MTLDLSPLLPVLRELPEYQQLLRELEAGNRMQFNAHLPRSIRPAIVCALHEDLNRPIFYLTARQDRFLTLKEEIPLWVVGTDLWPLPEPGPLFYEWSPWGDRILQQRIAALSALTLRASPGFPPEVSAGSNPIVIAPARAVMTRTLSTQQFHATSRFFRTGAMVRYAQLLELLVEIGYAHEQIVTEPGQMSRRGGLLDVWPPADVLPTRIEFFGDEIESLRSFDPRSQRTVDTLHWVRITPAREAPPRYVDQTWARLLPSSQPDSPIAQAQMAELYLPLMNPVPTSALQFLDADALLILDDEIQIENVIEEVEEHAVAMRNESAQTMELDESFPLPYLTKADLQEQFSQFARINFGLESTTGEELYEFEQRFTPGPRLGGQLTSIVKHIADARDSLETSIIISRQAPRLAELWAQQAGDMRLVDSVPTQFDVGEVFFLSGPLSEGWRLGHPGKGVIHLLTDAELFGWSRPQPRRRSLPHPTAPEQAYADLSVDDLIVHIDFGVGRFRGLVERTLSGTRKEYLLLEYADGDQLYVPIHQADRITRYVGADGSLPAISRLGGADWERSKGKAREAVEQVARDLLDLYARRLAVLGTAFPPDTPWQHELEASFSHQETEDQIQALEAIKRDMESLRPMDRLICGDVGYGKTEVALRAAFKAVMAGKQVAILVPTTVLAQQHYQTFRRRLAAFPVEVEMLSRFRTRGQSKAITEALENGQIDIIIGTHRLLQPDVQFKELGLLIIDEEQRFGVTHKEFLKQMRTEVDVLTLTATPIPRTLYMALTGARDISTISTPPEDRLPVMTHMGVYEPRVVRAAILRELDRGGQVFFVHNRVQTIATIVERLKALVPEGKFAMAHGQMPEGELSRVMDSFTAGEVDVLVSTSIIESGLDIPNANTLIVDRADRFGLAQLYQLRGRVGRAAIQGYAYFFRPTGRRVTDEALQRLEVIAEHSQLGAGYAIAMRDLEMRGAGEILGTRQHGYIASVGFHLYTRMLAAAVQRLRLTIDKDILPPGEWTAGLELPPASIELPLAGAIPESYVESRDLRLQLYRRLAEIRIPDELQSIKEELADRFGPPPEEVGDLLFQLLVKVKATGAGIDRILTENGQILIEFPPERDVEMLEQLRGDLRRSKRGLWLSARGNPGWKEDLLRVLENLRIGERMSAL